MRIVVTGATGLLGKATATFLVEQGHEVISVDRKEGDFAAGSKLVVGDLANLDFCDSVITGADGVAPRGRSHLEAWRGSSLGQIGIPQAGNICRVIEFDAPIAHGLRAGIAQGDEHFTTATPTGSDSMRYLQGTGCSSRRSNRIRRGLRNRLGRRRHRVGRGNRHLLVAGATRSTVSIDGRFPRRG